MILDLIVYDVLPFAVALAVLVLLVVYVPTIFIGILLGYIGCKYQTKLVDMCDKLAEKVSEEEKKNKIRDEC